MKILLYTDNHFCSHSSIIRRGGEKYSLRLENQIQSINWAEQLAIDEKCDAICHLGDFFDKSELNSEELTALKEIKWANLPHTFLCGNHEINSSNSEFNSLNALSKIGEVITEPKLDGGFGYNLIYLPYILESNRKSLKSYINALYAGMVSTQEVKHTIILSHNDISGIDYGYYISKQGFKIEDIEDSCDLFINGHLHNQNQVSRKIFNLGNLTGQNFGEDAFKFAHCAGILNTDNLQLECIVNPYAFNFYKLDVNNINDLDKYLFDPIAPAVVTIKTPISLMDEVKEIIKNNNAIIESRIVGVPEIKTEWSSNNEPIIKIDHMKQFKNYIIRELGDSDILREELDNI